MTEGVKLGLNLGQSVPLWVKLTSIWVKVFGSDSRNLDCLFLIQSYILVVEMVTTVLFKYHFCVFFLKYILKNENCTLTVSFLFFKNIFLKIIIIQLGHVDKTVQAISSILSITIFRLCGIFFLAQRLVPLWNLILCNLFRLQYWLSSSE